MRECSCSYRNSTTTAPALLTVVLSH